MEKKITKLGIMFIVVTMGIIMVLCGSSKTAATTVSVTDQKEMSEPLGMQAEVEVILPCSGVDSDDEFLRVNGNGSSKDRTMAKERACQTANPSTGSYICYVTIDFGKQKVVRELYENLSDQKLLKVDYDFSSYLEMFNKDLERI